MSPDVKRRDREKQNDKEHHDRASFVHIVFEKTSSSIPMLFLHVGKRSGETLRSSHSQMFFKIGILKNFSIFSKKTPVFVSFFNKAPGLFLLKKRFQRRCWKIVKCL